MLIAAEYEKQIDNDAVWQYRLFLFYSLTDQFVVSYDTVAAPGEN